MSDIAIRVEGLSKRYRIGGKQARYKTLRDTLAEACSAPFRRAAAVLSGQATEAAEEELWALKDVSFEVQPGEVVGIIGRNGAGKSTLLKVLSRITEPTEGRVEIHGRVGSLLEVGTGFHPELTGRENIFLNGAILGMKRAEIERKFDDIVDFAGIEKFLDTPVKHYSSGMYMRLAFAVAAHLDPEILLVDEVLAVGDAEFQKKCLGKMGEVSQSGRTVLFVSHNMLAIEALCPKAILLEKGELMTFGEAHPVIETYLKSMFKASQDKLASGNARNIRSVTIRNSEGLETDQFGVGEDIAFEIELFHTTFVEKPRVSIGIHTPNGERLLTIHTDIQQNSGWAFQGSKRLRATWRNNRLVPARYRIDVSFWRFSSEIESLPGAKYIEIVPRDVYGTGLLPDPRYQGHILVDASWDMNPGRPAEPSASSQPQGVSC